MSAIGIDLGGTKIEVQVFDNAWNISARNRIDTAGDYAALIKDVVGLIAWADAQTSGDLPVGIGAAGLVHPDSGLVFAANLAASQKPFPEDIARSAGRPITYLNDCRALALSEAIFGRGKDHHIVLALVLGTGIGGGIAVNGALLNGPTQTGGEFGHSAAPAHLIDQHNLPVWPCGCGRVGCIETYIAGPGLVRLAKHILGTDLTTPQIAARCHKDTKPVWEVWCALTVELLHTLTLTVDPNIIVLGGGLTQIDGILADLTKAAARTQFLGFAMPPIVLAEGGDTSGARGAAYAAWQAKDGA
jgi:predicted NBD/HSP70 family sugar kinase